MVCGTIGVSSIPSKRTFHRTPQIGEYTYLGNAPDEENRIQFLRKNEGYDMFRHNSKNTSHESGVSSSTLQGAAMRPFSSHCPEDEDRSVRRTRGCHVWMGVLHLPLGMWPPLLLGCPLCSSSIRLHNIWLRGWIGFPLAVPTCLEADNIDPCV